MKKPSPERDIVERLRSREWQYVDPRAPYLDEAADLIESLRKTPFSEALMIDIAARRVFAAWTRLGSCVDEVGVHCCDEYQSALDDTIIALGKIIKEADEISKKRNKQSAPVVDCQSP
jgi:hypothetical protein